MLTTKRAAICVASLAVLSIAGCGTLTRGHNEDVSIQTSPPGATVTTDTGMSCIGPCVLKVPRKQSFTATAHLDGYQDASMAVGSRISGGGGVSMAGNAVFGGLIGGGVDIASGAMYDHFPNPVALVLTPIEPAKASGPRKKKPAAVAAKPAPGV